MIDVVVLLVLMVLAIVDIKRHCIDVRVIGVIGSVCMVYGLYKLIGLAQVPDRLSITAGAIFVVFLMGMSIGANVLGMADVAIMCMLIIVKGVIFALCTFMWAVTVLAVVAGFLLVTKRVKRKQNVAFVPYIGLSALGVMLLG